MPRPRAEVWVELADRTHPAWSDGDEDGWALVEGSPPFGLGTRRVSPFVTGPPYGIHTTLCSTITEFVEGWRVTSVLFAGSWEHTETLTLSETLAGDTYVDILGWMSCVTTEAMGQVHQRRLTYLAEKYLQRAQQWSPGDPARPIIVPRDI